MNLRIFTGDNGDNGSEYRATGTDGRLRARERAARKAAGTSFQPSSPRMRATLRTAGIRPAVLPPKIIKQSPPVAESGAGTSGASVEGTQASDVRLLVASELAKALATFLPVAQTAQAVVPPAPREVAAVPQLSLVDLYRENVMPGEMAKNEPKTIRSDVAKIQKFQEWLQIQEQRTGSPKRADLEIVASAKDCLREYAAHLRSQKKGGSAATVHQSMNAIRKLCKWANEAGHLEKIPSAPSKGDVNEMATGSDDDDSEFRAEPVTVEEFRRLSDPDVLAACTWPRLGDVSPATFWETVLVSHMALGFRSQDWFSREAGKLGLVWSDVISETKCPRLDDVHNASGWCWYLVNKTKKKSKRAAKPTKLLVPLSRRLRELIEQFRGIDSVRVFPLPKNGRYWAAEFQGILDRAGMDDASRKAAGKPVIELSLGQTRIASFRKGCANLWADHVSEEAASYLLQHSVTDSKVAATTREHYLRIYRPLKDIVPALESLPIWN